MHPVRHPRWSSLAALFVLAGAVGIMSGCVMTRDLGTGVSLERNNSSRCIKTCVDAYHDLVRAEANAHQAQIRACRELGESERRACHAAEVERHKAVMAQIAAGRRDCMNDCHRQGGGNAG